MVLCSEQQRLGLVLTIEATVWLATIRFQSFFSSRARGSKVPSFSDVVNESSFIREKVVVVKLSSRDNGVVDALQNVPALGDVTEAQELIVRLVRDAPS